MSEKKGRETQLHEPKTLIDSTDIGKEKANVELMSFIDELLTQGDSMDTEVLELYLAQLQSRTPVMENYDVNAKIEELKEKKQFQLEEDTTNASVTSRITSVQSSPKNVLRIFRTVSVAAAVMLALAVSSSAINFGFIESFFKWAEELVLVAHDPSGTMELAEGSQDEYRSLNEALNANNIDPSTCPTWIPHEFSLRSVALKRSGGTTKYTATYLSSEAQLSIRVTHINDSTWVSQAEREDEGTSYIHNGLEFYITTNYERNKAGWQIDECSYVVSGEISKEDLIKIINSIPYTNTKNKE